MMLTDAVARQIAELLNSQNQLTRKYTVESIKARAEALIAHTAADGTVLGVVEVQRVQWYQCEILHLSVASTAQRQGMGTLLLAKAEDRARQLGARMTQCTIRLGNAASERTFLKAGYSRTLVFKNPNTNHDVGVYQHQL